jgi:hypothetical protein
MAHLIYITKEQTLCQSAVKFKAFPNSRQMVTVILLRSVALCYILMFRTIDHLILTLTYTHVHTYAIHYNDKLPNSSLTMPSNNYDLPVGTASTTNGILGISRSPYFAYTTRYPSFKGAHVTVTIVAEHVSLEPCTTVSALVY